MQARVIGGIFVLAYLLSKGKAQELESYKDTKALPDVKDLGLRQIGESEAPGDLNSEISLDVTKTKYQDNEGRSGAISQNNARASAESSLPNVAGQSRDDGLSLAHSDSLGDTSQSREAIVIGGAQTLPFNQAETKAISDTSNGLGQNSYPYSSSYPYSPGFSSAQAQSEADRGLYQPSQILNPYNRANGGYYQPEPIFNKYGQGLDPAQGQLQADKRLYPPGYSGAPSWSPYNQGSSFPQIQGPADSESHQTKTDPIFMQSKSDPRRNQVSESHSSLSNPYNLDLVSSSAKTQVQTNSRSYQAIPIPNLSSSPDEHFLVPYKQSSFIQENEKDESLPLINPKDDQHSGSLSQKATWVLIDSDDNDEYQAIPIPDPKRAPYDSYLVPYRDPSSNNAQTVNKEYQPIPMSKSSLNQQDDLISRSFSETYFPDSFLSSNSYRLRPNSAKSQSTINSGSYQSISLPNTLPNEAYLVSRSKLSSSQGQISNIAYQQIPNQRPGLKTNPSHDEIELYQSDSKTDINSPTRQDENNSYKPIPGSANPEPEVPLSTSYAYNVGKSREYNATTDDVDSSLDKSRNGWISYTYNRYPPLGPNPQLYTSGAETASGVANRYNPGIIQYPSDYLSEIAYRPVNYYQTDDEALGPPKPIARQNSLGAFEDAKSRKISPNEYVFPNKTPGGENVVQCTKENEFHHFWSQGVDCMVCICLNEYGVLSPVCASCGGCRNPPPKLPEQPKLPELIPVQPATPEVPPAPYPVMPEPIPILPGQEPYQPVPTPYPGYPEVPSLLSTSSPAPALPSPIPVQFPEPVVTLPTPPEEASCSPLPTGKPFTNPLHPCQICTCSEFYVSGKHDVQIECKENPQCSEYPFGSAPYQIQVAPADVTTLPPLPDVPVPIPLPICEKFPEHVLFPHPTESCKLCKCAKNVSESGVPEQQLTCYPHPDCIPITESIPNLPIPIDPFQTKPHPKPGPLPSEPLKEPFPPVEPVPLPEVVTVEPLPWPPITTIAPVPALPVLSPRPGPLPGPSPHESCRPYPPNQPFQHPWDECQVCLCTEAVATTMIEVEINCYTKPTCCIDPPDSVKTALPGFSAPYLGANNINSPDQPGATSTYKPLPLYPPYNPRPVSVYPGSNPPSGADALTNPQVYAPQAFPRVPAEGGFVDPTSSYPYQPNYPSPYVNPLYPEYPPRPVSSTNPVGSYTSSNFGYPANYQYAQGDGVGVYPGPQGLYPPYDARYPSVPAPSVYPPVYTRSNLELPSIYGPGQGRPLSSPQSVPNSQNLAPSRGTIARTKSGKDGIEDTDESR